MNEFVLQQNQTQFAVRRDHPSLGMIRSIERWPDHNYAPHTLDTMATLTPISFQIIAGLHGYTAEDVHVDLARGCVMILIARDEDFPSSQPLEYYCEVPIPVEAQPNIACVEIEGDFVTVTLDRKQASPIRRAIEEIARLKNNGALLLGNGRAIRLFDSPPYQPPAC